MTCWKSLLLARRRPPVWLAALCFALAVAAAFAVRTHDFNREAKRLGDFVPFTLESAMMYSYAKDVADQGHIPQYDKRLLGMDKVTVDRQMSSLMEYFLGYGYRLKNLVWKAPETARRATDYEDNPDFTHWARCQIRLWISLGAGLLFLWLLALRCPWFLAFSGAMLFAVSPAAVARGTGQDLIRENFAIPLILATLYFFHSHLVSPRRWKLAALAACAFLALSAWDMCQLLFAVWGLFEIVRSLCGGVVNPKRRAAWLVLVATAVAAALSVPYLQTHRFLFSPAVCVIFPLLLLSFRERGPDRRRQLRVLGCWALGLLALWYFGWSELGYKGNYGHFGSLLKAKVMFLNVKPLDPAKLDFDARLLWTPALHSATWNIHKHLFHLTTYVLAALLGAALCFPTPRRALRRGLGRSALPLAFFGFYFFLFVFMVRFHALAIPFLCVSLALLADDWGRTPFKLARPILTCLLPLLVLSEFEWFTRLSRDYDPGPGKYRLITQGNLGYFEAQKELVKWFRENPSEDAVLANFTLSPLLKAYCGRAILLQPKFELGKTRDMVEQYIETMYHGNLMQLNKFCVDNGVKYLVFDRGMAGPMHPFSNRYHACAKLLEPLSPVTQLFSEPDNSRLFYRLDDAPKSKEFAQKFTVFKVISPADHARSRKYLDDGERSLSHGDISAARRLAKAAVYADPAAEDVRLFHYQVFGKIPFIRLRGY